MFHLEKPRFLPSEAYERYDLSERATPRPIPSRPFPFWPNWMSACSG